jgi:leucyl-tRNA synthetase
MAEKEGVPLGIDAIHPITGEKVPVWVANFVLMEYGSGAVMAVPAHDTRDYDFAKKYGLPIEPVVFPKEGELPENEAYTEDGVLKGCGDMAFETIPPHEVLQQPVKDFYPYGPDADLLVDLMEKAEAELADHDINSAAPTTATNENPAVQAAPRPAP